MPVLSALEFAIDVTEGDPAVLIDGAVNVTDAEQDYDGGTLVVGGLAPGDIISLLDGGQILLSGNDILFGGLTIGSFGVNGDGDFVVTFTSDADNAAVEAVVESLQFQSTGDNPWYFRELTVAITDAAGNVSPFGMAATPQQGADDPFHGLSFGSTARVAVGDIDSDGDVDVVVNVYGDGFHLLRNVGSASAPDFQQDDAGLSITGVVNNSAGITLADVNGDGFLDLVVGKYDGTLQQFNGDGTGAFVEQVGAASAFNGIDVYPGASPGLSDLNGDGFIDLVIARGGRFSWFEGGAGGFTELTGANNPLDAFVSYGGQGSVSFGDIDGDGDLDMISGSGEAATGVFVNTGDSSTPIFEVLSGSHYEGAFSTGFQPVLVDIDNDGDLDVIQGDSGGDVTLIEVAPAVPSIDVVVEGVDDAAIVSDETVNTDASGPISGNLLSNDSDVDNDLEIVAATVNGDSVIIDGPNTLPDGVRLSLSYDGTYVFTLTGSAAQALGASGSGASNTSLQYVLVYTLLGGETGTATITVAGVDDKDLLQGTAGDDLIRAGVGNDTVYGLDGMDMLYGDDGNDTLFGGNATDLLTGGNGADKAYGEGGADTLYAGDGADYLYGGDANDTLRGEADNDYLDGGVGNDTMFGGTGNDVYIIDSVNDAVSEAADEGYDILRSTVSIEVLVDNVEAVQLQGTADLYATGNGGANNLQGNAGANTLTGGAGVDTLNGNDGDDRIAGGVGNDLLRGGMGADTFFVFQESVGGAVLETDQIYDFNAAEGDIIDLSFIDANSRVNGNQSFHLVGAFTKYDAAHPEDTGQMTLTFAGGITTVRLDVNGDAKVDYQMKINGDVTGESGDWLL
ncbi:MAG: hemolysin-type calcium-binding repeat family protein [Caulobacter sp.]|nr:hemolysin-type calcium-binding repeat family protein [Caulobacter sp.]